MIIDASVAIKWLVQEDKSELADQLLVREPLCAPDLLGPEIANVVWKKWRRGELAGVPPSFGDVMQSFDHVEPSAGLMKRAAEIALELDHPAYDCFYLALAEALDDILVTLDARVDQGRRRFRLRRSGQTTG